MVRRSLRKLESKVDLSRHLKRFEELPRPWDTAALFQRPAPLEVEVGSGKGLFLASAAAAHPEVNYLGIELSHRYCCYTAARLARRSVSNALVVQADAVQVFREVLADNSLQAVHVYFPDPWWKARHKKRRVMNEAMARDIERRLRPGGVLHFWTDVEEYFQSTLELLAESTSLQGPIPVPEAAAQHDLDYRTHFERRTRLEERPVYRAQFQKPAP